MDWIEIILVLFVVSSLVITWVYFMNFDNVTKREVNNMNNEYKEFSATTSMIEHPAHYNRPGAMECIEEMRWVFGDAEVASFCKLNAWKYRYRAADKGGYDDLLKSDFYMKKYVELIPEGASK